MEYTQVTSSVIKEIGYDSKTSTLGIKFHNGGIYHYQPITHYGYNRFLFAESKGKFFQKNIKDNELIEVGRVYYTNTAFNPSALEPGNEVITHNDGQRTLGRNKEDSEM